MVNFWHKNFGKGGTGEGGRPTVLTSLSVSDMCWWYSGVSNEYNEDFI